MQALEAVTSISFRNILFLTDFTEASEPALAFAKSFARRYDAHFYPAHVQMPSEGNFETAARKLEENRERAAQTVRGLDLNFEPIAREGFIEEVVPQLIAEHGIDLIVMGTHGRKGVSRLLLGSTAETIFRSVSCPVVTVGPNVAETPNWKTRIGSVLVAADLSLASEHSIPYALSFARESHCRFTLMHVVPKEYRSHSDASLMRSLEGELKKLVPKESKAWCQPQIVVTKGRPAEEILRTADDSRADLIVLGLPRKKEFTTHFRTGVTYSVISQARCPVLTVRDFNILA